MHAPNNVRHGAPWWLVACALALAIPLIGELDRLIAHALFYGPHGWLGAGGGGWWARDLLHQGGRWLPRCVAAAALLGWLLSFRSARLAPWRRELAYVFVGMAAIIVLVGGLKVVTNVDCPWDLAGFGGNRPYVPLLAGRPHYLPEARCFPGAHSSSGFALITLWFALRARAPRWGRALLAFALLVGIAFAFGQEARGAHFLSHDLTSALIAWSVARLLHPLMLASRRPGALDAAAQIAAVPVPAPRTGL